MRKIRNTFSLFSAFVLCVICISSLSLTSHAHTFDSSSTTYTATQSHQHKWMPVGFIPRTHPHTTKVSCQCGDTRYNCVLLTGVPADCNLCKSNTKTASSSTKKIGSFSLHRRRPRCRCSYYGTCCIGDPIYQQI